jgi:hypothetical protein
MQWIRTHWLEVGIGAILIVGYGYGLVMKLLELQRATLDIKKMRLEIDSLKTSSEKLSLEIEQLKREKGRDEKAERANALAKRIMEHVKPRLINTLNERQPVVLTLQELSAILNRTPDDIEGALFILRGEQRVRQDRMRADSWIFS